jgi:uncharacterized membrane protein YhaH (DUF805 family)
MTAETVRNYWLMALINLVIFFVVALALGGSAMYGSHSSGHYFLINHGRSTEVSRAVWLYSYAHSLLTIALLISAIALKTFYGRKARG